MVADLPLWRCHVGVDDDDEDQGVSPLFACVWKACPSWGGAMTLMTNNKQEVSDASKYKGWILAVVLIDSRSSRGSRFFFVTHSSIHSLIFIYFCIVRSILMIVQK